MRRWRLQVGPRRAEFRGHRRRLPVYSGEGSSLGQQRSSNLAVALKHRYALPTDNVKRASALDQHSHTPIHQASRGGVDSGVRHRVQHSSVEHPESRRIAVTLARHAADGANAAHIAGAIVSTWQDIDTALRPILGQRGVFSLYRRSVHLTVAGHPWFAEMRDGMQTALDLPALEATLAKQGSRNAAAGGGDLLQAFHELLASLVGASLTEQLLRSIWANSSSGDAAQDGSR